MLIALQDHFGHEGFPLANSATEVRTGAAAPGIGSFYFNADPQHANPPDTSKLVAILDQLGVLVPCAHNIRRSRLWTIAPGFDSMQLVFSHHIDGQDRL